MSAETLDAIKAAVQAHLEQRNPGYAKTVDALVVCVSEALISSNDKGEPVFGYSRTYISTGGHPWADVGLVMKVLSDIDDDTDYDPERDD